MDASLQLAISISVPTLAVLVGILINNSRLSDLRSHMVTPVSPMSTNVSTI